jgi:hypothetical protein
MNNRQISEQAGVDEDVYTWNQIQLERFAELVRQDEREFCAKLCEITNDGTPYNLTEQCAAAIRARGNT